MKLTIIFLMSFLALTANAANMRQRFADFEYAVVTGNIKGWKLERKTGLNADVDNAAPEDVWAAGALYVFPTAALATTIVSSDTDDDVGGIGCTSVKITGLDINYIEISETIAMDGTTVVPLVNNYFRINFGECMSSGSNESNVGDIDILHGATVIGRMPPENGVIQQLIYTVPAGFSWLVDRFVMYVQKKPTVTQVVELQVKPFATQTWKTVIITGLHSQGSSTSDNFPSNKRPFLFTEKTDVRVRVVSNDTLNTQTSGNLSGFLVDQKYPGI